jgi:aldose 1-epimerase
MARMTAPLELRNAALHLSLRPDLGGCIEGLWHHALPVLRSSAPGTLQNVRDCASYPLVPFSNRVAQARLEWKGTSHPLVKNFGTEAHSIHGVGWQRAWQVLDADASFAMLSLEHKPSSAWPFAFDASQTFRLKDDTLELTMSITNQSAGDAPVGLGWHPYFVKRARSRMAFAATGRWEMGDDKIPTGRSPVSGLDADCAYLDVDHCFDGWNGTLHLRDELFHMTLSSSLRRLVVYTTPEKDFVAIEPVSHVNNAMNQSTRAQELGVEVLSAGQSWSASMNLKIQKI